MTDEEKEQIKQAIRLVAPVVPGLILSTDPLSRTYSTMRMPLYIREPGCWLSSPFGSGKTTALKYCLRSLRDEIPEQPAYLINEQVLPGNELRSFFVRALQESGHAITGLSTTDKLRNRLAQYWAELSAEAPLRCVVLFLDEGQAMRETDVMLLKGLGNEIGLHGGALQTFIFGEGPAFDNQVAARKEKRDGAADRLFFGHKLPLHTYQTQKDWGSAFRELFEAKLDALGGRTVYEAYFGHLSRCDFDIESDAIQFCKALRSLRKEKVKINLRRTFVAINMALLTFALQSVEKGLTKYSGLEEERWLVALRYAALIEN